MTELGKIMVTDSFGCPQRRWSRLDVVCLIQRRVTAENALCSPKEILQKDGFSIFDNVWTYDTSIFDQSNVENSLWLPNFKVSFVL
jgi:hypothetical protein